MSSAPIMESGRIPALSLLDCKAAFATVEEPPFNDSTLPSPPRIPAELGQVPVAKQQPGTAEPADNLSKESEFSGMRLPEPLPASTRGPTEIEPAHVGERAQVNGGKRPHPAAAQLAAAQQRGTSLANGSSPADECSPPNGHLQSIGLRTASDSGNGLHNGKNGAIVKLHRIREVREQQGLSIRSVARRLGIDVKSYRQLEDPNHNLSLAELHAIQMALDVPFADLLVDRQSLSQPVLERPKLVKVMKSAVAIREAKSNPRVERLAQMLCEQLTDLMPELAQVSGWPQFGARRGQSALGKALREPIDTSQLGLSE